MRKYNLQYREYVKKLYPFDKEKNYVFFVTFNYKLKYILTHFLLLQIDAKFSDDK